MPTTKTLKPVCHRFNLLFRLRLVSTLIKINRIMLASILLASLFISLLSFSGVFLLSLKPARLNQVVMFLVAFAAGVMLGSVFFHLLPAALVDLPDQTVMTLTLTAFIAFLLLERLFAWRHCHQQNCSIHSFGIMNLVGDGIHNFIDGLILAAAFMADPGLGLTTTLAVALHEIPQEIGDFGVLLHAGFTRSRALILNFLTALLALLGALVGYFFLSQSADLATYLLPIAAGGFLYIAASDLLPEIKRQTHFSRNFISILVLIVGILFIGQL